MTEHLTMVANSSDTGIINVTEHRQLRGKITVRAAKQSFTNFIQKVTNMSFGMSDSPSSRYMSLAVLYTDDTPEWLTTQHAWRKGEGGDDVGEGGMAS